MEGIKVLVVDDEQEFAETLCMRLETRSFRPAAVFNGEDALSRLREQDFDVVILDVVMPGKDGIQVLQEIKFLKPLTEVIMLSGHANLETAIKGMQFGAFDFLVKPPDIGDLVEKINKGFVRKADHEERIRKAGFVKDQIEKDITAPAAEPDGDESRLSKSVASDLGRLLVIGRESDFSPELIRYALAMSKRMSYQILALNAAGFNNESFKLFPTARDRVCQDFLVISEKNAALFRKAAEKDGVPFVHAVKYSDQDDAIDELRKELGDIDYVVCESEDEPGRGQIVAYTPL